MGLWAGATGVVGGEGGGGGGADVVAGVSAMLGQVLGASANWQSQLLWTGVVEGRAAEVSEE